MPLLRSIRYILSIPSNLLIVIGSSLGFFYLGGLNTFALLFVKGQYHASQATAELVLAMLVVGAIVGTLLGGRITDVLLRRGNLEARVWFPAACYIGAAVLLIPGFLGSHLTPALWFDVAGAALLAAANPPTQAARLDIMPAGLWGRAESVRTFVRSLFMAAAPLVFGGLAQLIAGIVPSQAPIGTPPTSQPRRPPRSRPTPRSPCLSPSHGSGHSVAPDQLLKRADHRAHAGQADPALDPERLHAGLRPQDGAVRRLGLHPVRQQHARGPRRRPRLVLRSVVELGVVAPQRPDPPDEARNERSVAVLEQHERRLAKQLIEGDTRRRAGNPPAHRSPQRPRIADPHAPGRLPEAIGGRRCAATARRGCRRRCGRCSSGSP